MTDLTYIIVEHDGGWAYKVGDTFSETFASHDAALKAAQRAAGEQRVSGETEGITYEDKNAVLASGSLVRRGSPHHSRQGRLTAQS